MRRPGNFPCQTILHPLKFQFVLESSIMIKGIAMVKSTVNTNNCNSFVNIERHDEGHECNKSSNDKFMKNAV